MTERVDPVELAAQLIACPSVTPAEAGVMSVLAETLAPLGFTVHRFSSGAAPDGPVENMFATRGGGGPHFAFAGHVDVVPAGEGWTGSAFTPEVKAGLLHGRGAVDMKGAIAAFVAATADLPEHEGTLSLIITGDEEGPAQFGTRAIIEWMETRGIRPDMILVGEPTSETKLGDTAKIGRRGSINITIDVTGVQGHVAYPHLADNPIPALARIVTALDALTFDEGTEWFQPTNLEFSELSVGSPASNVIPGAARARLNIRFNDLQTGEALAERVRQTVREIAPDALVDARISGEAFVTAPGLLSDIVSDAVEAETGLRPSLTTGGGTSDARFLVKLCPVVEFGLPNATMHKLDEAVAIDDLETLRRIYARIIRAAFASAG